MERSRAGIGDLLWKDAATPPCCCRKEAGGLNTLTSVSSLLPVSCWYSHGLHPESKENTAAVHTEPLLRHRAGERAREWIWVGRATEYPTHLIRSMTIPRDINGNP